MNLAPLKPQRTLGFRFERTASAAALTGGEAAGLWSGVLNGWSC